MEFKPVEGKPVRFPPGKVAIKLSKDRWMDYRRAYSRSSTDLAGLPRLRERDFDGRTVLVSQAQLDALNAAFFRLHAPRAAETGTVFEAQERFKTRLFKRTKTLS